MTKTILRRHYMLTMRLDLAGVDLDYLRSLAQRFEAVDATPSTLAHEQRGDANAIRKAYACHTECRKQQPPVELRQEPIAFDKWLSAFVEGAEAAPHLYFLALHRQEYIGVCLFVPKPQESGVLESGFTGVLPVWSGHGIAKALKAHGLLCAKQHGYRYVETSVLVVNREMCAINRSLGFQIVRRHLHTYPIPIAALAPDR